MMTAVTPEEFYQANIDKEKEYVRIYAAFEVKAGEESATGVAGPIVKEDGYELNRRRNGFLGKAEFERKASPAEKLPLPVPKENLSENELQSIKLIRKGERIIVKFSPNGTLHKVAEYNGCIIKSETDGCEMYLSNFELASQFNYAGQKYEPEKERIVTLSDEPPLKGILLDEETTFAFRSGNKTIPAGSLLYLDPASEDGYSTEIMPAPRNRFHLSANARLRLSPAWIAHQTAAGKQARLNARAPRLKLQ